MCRQRRPTPEGISKDVRGLLAGNSETFKLKYYEILIEDIRQAKYQQWLIGSGVTALYGLCIGINFPTCLLRIAAVATCSLITILAGIAILCSGLSLRIYRIQKDVVLRGEPKPKRYSWALYAITGLAGAIILAFTILSIVNRPFPEQII